VFEGVTEKTPPRPTSSTQKHIAHNVQSTYINACHLNGGKLHFNTF
jgi:hypothetical protein